jgi:hypothetical protein
MHGTFNINDAAERTCSCGCGRTALTAKNVGGGRVVVTYRATDGSIGAVTYKGGA